MCCERTRELVTTTTLTAPVTMLGWLLLVGP